MAMRKTNISRKTKETKVSVYLNLDGKGKYDIKTTLPFFDHMLSAFAKHGLFDLKIVARGDREIDDHHLLEDIGLSLGMAVRKCLGNKKGIGRYGNFLMPMDEALSYVVIDISDRPHLKYNVRFNKTYDETFNFDLIEDFFQALVAESKITLHIAMKSGRNNHHIAEAVFKGFGKALSMAVAIKGKGVPSTKGKL